jgi:hypothetical protein
VGHSYFVELAKLAIPLATFDMVSDLDRMQIKRGWPLSQTM